MHLEGCAFARAGAFSKMKNGLRSAKSDSHALDRQQVRDGILVSAVALQQKAIW